MNNFSESVIMKGSDEASKIKELRPICLYILSALQTNFVDFFIRNSRRTV